MTPIFSLFSSFTPGKLVLLDPREIREVQSPFLKFCRNLFHQDKVNLMFREMNLADCFMKWGKGKKVKRISRNEAKKSVFCSFYRHFQSKLFGLFGA